MGKRKNKNLPSMVKTEMKYLSCTFGATLSAMRSIEDLNALIAAAIGDSLDINFTHYYYKTQIFASKPARVEFVCILAQNGATLTATDGDPTVNSMSTDWDLAIDKPFEVYPIAKIDVNDLVYQSKNGADAVPVYFNRNPQVMNLMPVINKLSKQVENSNVLYPIQVWFAYRAIGISTGETVDIRSVKSMGWNTSPGRPAIRL